MQIAITNPYCWPEVRRGSERLLEDLSAYLAGRGHDVTAISTHRGPRLVKDSGNRRFVLLPQRLSGCGMGRWLGPLHVFSLQCLREIERGAFDVVHALSYHDAFGAALAKGRGKKFRLVLHLVGIPVKEYFRRIPLDYVMFKQAIKAADEIILVLSAYAREALERNFGRTGTIVPPPVNLDGFQPKLKPVGGPVKLLFVGDVDEQRKGAGPLVNASVAIKDQFPDTDLQFSGHVSEKRRSALLTQVAGSTDLPYRSWTSEESATCRSCIGNRMLRSFRPSGRPLAWRSWSLLPAAHLS